MMMRGIYCSHATAVAFVLVLIIATCGVESSLIEPSYHHPSRPQKSSTTWNGLILPLKTRNHKVGTLTGHPSRSPRSNSCLCAAKGTNDNKPLSNNNNNNNKKQMVGYNDDAFGLIFLTGGILSQDADFVVTFVALSAIAAFASNSLKIIDTRLPGLVAMVTLVSTPIVTYLHATIIMMMNDGPQGGSIGWAAPQPIEIGLCLVSLAWSFAKWKQEQNE
jgi:hypothetical protein